MIKTRFYINHGRRCAQTAIKSVATKNAFSFQELDQLTGREYGQITIPLQIAYALHKLGGDFLYPVKPFFAEGDIDEFEFVSERSFGKGICDRVNFRFIEKAWKDLKNSEECSLYFNFNLENIVRLISTGKIPVILINYDKFLGREDKNNGHYLVLHEIGLDFARIMDSGPINADADKIIPRKRLEDSWMQTPLDYGVVFV